MEDEIVKEFLIEGYEILDGLDNDLIALAKLPDLAPDVVVLGVEMPEMDGLETLRVLRRDHPYLLVFARHRFIVPIPRSQGYASSNSTEGQKFEPLTPLVKR